MKQIMNLDWEKLILEENILENKKVSLFLEGRAYLLQQTYCDMQQYHIELIDMFIQDKNSNEDLYEKIKDTQKDVQKLVFSYDTLGDALIQLITNKINNISTINYDYLFIEIENDFLIKYLNNEKLELQDLCSNSQFNKYRLFNNDLIAKSKENEIIINTYLSFILNKTVQGNTGVSFLEISNSEMINKFFNNYQMPDDVIWKKERDETACFVFENLLNHIVEDEYNLKKFDQEISWYYLENNAFEKIINKICLEREYSTKQRNNLIRKMYANYKKFNYTGVTENSIKRNIIYFNNLKALDNKIFIERIKKHVESISLDYKKELSCVIEKILTVDEINNDIEFFKKYLPSVLSTTSLSMDDFYQENEEEIKTFNIKVIDMYNKYPNQLGYWYFYENIKMMFEQFCVLSKIKLLTYENKKEIKENRKLGTIVESYSFAIMSNDLSIFTNQYIKKIFILIHKEMEELSKIEKSFDQIEENEQNALIRKIYLTLATPEKEETNPKIKKKI